MQQFLDNVTSIYWWLAVVFVGIAINLTSAFLKPWLDNILGKTSKSWAEKNAKRREEFSNEVKRISTSTHLQLMLVATESRERMNSIFKMLLGVFIYLSAIILRTFPEFNSMPYVIVLLLITICSFCGALLYGMSYYSYRKANHYQMLLSVAQKESRETIVA
jgi:hypothetical protein